VNASGFLRLVATQATIIRRNTGYWMGSILFAIISMAAFGWLFNPDGQALDIAVVDEDGTEASQSLVEAFASLDNADLTVGSRQQELDALEDGDRGAVVIVPRGFEEGAQAGATALEVLYDNSNPIRIGFVTSTVEAVVEAYNEEVMGNVDVVRLVERGIETEDVRYVDFLAPGMVGMTVMWVNLGVGFLMVTWREQGILRRLGVTPLRPGALIGSQAVSFGVMSLVQVTIVLTMAALIFGVEVTGSFLWLAVTVVLGVLAFLSIGYVIASRLSTVTAVSAITNLVAFPMMFLGGSYFPLSAPKVLETVVEAVPLTHLNDALREVVNHNAGIGDLWVSWAVLAGWIVAGYLVSIRSFRWQ
jgi:ABC-2 type transport system permease protein